MNRTDYINRKHKIPEPILEIGLNNPAVARIIDMYTHGDICTLQEALCQMVVHLSKNWDTQREAYMHLQALSYLPPTIKPSNE